MEHSTKKGLISKECKYGFHHFCDGTPNLSVLKKGGEKPQRLIPCPARYNCPIRAVSIFDKGAERK